MPNLGIIFLLLGLAKNIHAKNWDGYGHRATTVRMGFVTPKLKQLISNPENSSAKEVDYEPNINSKFGIGLSVGNLALSGSFSQRKDQSSESHFGQTTSTDYQIRFYGDVHSYDIFYQRYSGFYIENSNDIDPAYSGISDRIKRSDVEIEHYGVQYFYNFHSQNFHPGYFDQSAIPRKSGGSLFLMLAANHHRIAADSPLVPSELAGTYGQFENFSGGHFQTIKIGPAAGYCFVFKGFYLAGMGIITGGQQRQSYSLLGENKTKVLPQSSMSFKIGGGFNIQNFFISYNLIVDNTLFTIENARVAASTIESTIWTGFRF
ncbi:MAG: DUF4421 family protein [Pseudobdellovibrionaceae bacterium]